MAHSRNDFINRELHAFMFDVEAAIVRIQQVLAEPLNESGVEWILLQSELVLRDTMVVEELLPVQDGQMMVNIIVSVVRAIQELLDEFRRSRLRGRPQIPISEEQLMSLLELQFSNQEIARLLCVSPRTIRRRILLFGLQDDANFTTMDDTCLDAITQQFTDTHPNSGERSLSGFLRSAGLRVQRCRIRESLMRTDPRGVQCRFRQVLHRRQYNVAMPNSLWHIDGYHRLIRWRIVIHGGIDGYSRLPVYLTASSNNRASTVLIAFWVLYSNMDCHHELSVTVEERMLEYLNSC